MIKIKKIILKRHPGTMPMTYSSELVINPKEITYSRDGSLKEKPFKWWTPIIAKEFNTLYFEDKSRDCYILDKNVIDQRNILKNKKITVYDAAYYTLIVEYSDGSKIEHDFMPYDFKGGYLLLKKIINAINNLIPNILPWEIFKF